MKNLSDDALIERYLAGAGEAFDELFARYTPQLLGFARSLGAAGDEAEDLAQSVWLKALGALDSYRPAGRFRPWLFTLCHRLWISARRPARERHTAPLENGMLAELAADDDPRAAAAAREERRHVEEALTELPAEMRQTVLLRIDGELTFREIAETMNCPEGTVHWRMQEARKRLCERLAPRPAALAKEEAR